MPKERKGARKRPPTQETPESAAARKPLVALAAVGAVAVLVACICAVAWQANAASEREERWRALPGKVNEARSAKANGDIPAAARLYQAACASVEGAGVAPLEAGSLLDEARAEKEACEDYLFKPKADFVVGCKDPSLLFAATDDLARSQDAKAMEGLATLCTKERAVALRAVAAIKIRGGAAAPEALVRALSSKDEEVARAAARAIVSLDAPGVGDALAKTIERFPGDTGLSAAVADAARRLKDSSAVTVLRRLARDKREATSEPAILQLAELANAASVPELLLGLESHEMLQASVTAALRKIGEPAVPPLAQALEKGLSQAARPLAAIGTPSATAALDRALAKPSWQDRATVLESMSAEAQAAKNPSVRGLVARVLAEARVAAGGKESPDRFALASVVHAARAYGFNEAAQDLRIELAFAEYAAMHAMAFGSWKREKRADLDRNGRIELKNDTNVRMVLYAKGPERVIMSIPAGTTKGRTVPAGRYRVGAAVLDDSGSEHGPHVGTIDVVQGSASQCTFIMPPERKQLAGAPKGRGARLFDHAVRLLEIRDEVLRTAARAALESPWAQGGTEVRTEHYTLSTDADPESAGRVAKELEAAYSEMRATLGADQGGRGLVRFFTRRADYERWRARTSFISLLNAAIVSEWKLADRARAQARRLRALPEQAALLEAIARALEQPLALELVLAEDLLDFDGSLAEAEETPGDREALEPLRRSVSILGSLALVAETLAAAGPPPSVHDPFTGQVSVLGVQGWEASLRHACLYQLVGSRDAPHWLKQALASYFEERRRGSVDRTFTRDRLDPQNLSLIAVFRGDDVGLAADTAALALIAFLEETEPGAVAHIFAAAHANGVPEDLLSVFKDPAATERRWRSWAAGKLGR